MRTYRCCHAAFLIVIFSVAYSRNIFSVSINSDEGKRVIEKSNETTLHSSKIKSVADFSATASKSNVKNAFNTLFKGYVYLGYITISRNVLKHAYQKSFQVVFPDSKNLSTPIQHKGDNRELIPLDSEQFSFSDSEKYNILNHRMKRDMQVNMEVSKDRKHSTIKSPNTTTSTYKENIIPTFLTVTGFLELFSLFYNMGKNQMLTKSNLEFPPKPNVSYTPFYPTRRETTTTSRINVERNINSNERHNDVTSSTDTLPGHKPDPDDDVTRFYPSTETKTNTDGGNKKENLITNSSPKPELREMNETTPGNTEVLSRDILRRNETVNDLDGNAEEITINKPKVLNTTSFNCSIDFKLDFLQSEESLMIKVPCEISESVPNITENIFRPNEDSAEDKLIAALNKGRKFTPFDDDDIVEKPNTYFPYSFVADFSLFNCEDIYNCMVNNECRICTSDGYYD